MGTSADASADTEAPHSFAANWFCGLLLTSSSVFFRAALFFSTTIISIHIMPPLDVESDATILNDAAPADSAGSDDVNALSRNTGVVEVSNSIRRCASFERSSHSFHVTASLYQRRDPK